MFLDRWLRVLAAGLALVAWTAGCSSPPPEQLARERGEVALALAPDDPVALHGLARCHVALGDGEAALDVFARLQHADAVYFRRRAATDYQFALYQAAKQALHRGDSTLALRRVRKLQRAGPRHSGLGELTTEVLIAEAGRLQVAGQPELAEPLLTEAVGRVSEGVPEAAFLAETLMQRGRVDRAISVLSDALLRHPGDPRLVALMDRALEIRYPQ